ncbi:MAG: polysaccharide biosynthesis C-terminal domain-containing protein [Chitinophagaceae bacterium]
MKLSGFVKGLSWLVALNIIVKPLWIFGIDRQLQNTVGPETYGSYFSILSLSIVLSFIMDVGITNRLNRQLASGFAADIKKMFWLKCLLSLFYLIIIYAVCLFSGIEKTEIVLLVCGIQILTSFLVFFRGLLTAEQKFVKDAWISIIDKLLMIFIVGSLFYLPFFTTSITLIIFLWIQMACTAFTVLIAFSLTANIFNKYKHFSESAFHIIQSSLPFIIIILLMSVHNRLDSFLLERMHDNGAYEAGIYASAFRLLDAGNMVGYLAASFLVPFVARNLKTTLLIQKIVLNLQHALIVFSVLTVSFITVFSNWVRELLYPAIADYASNIIVFTIAVLPAYYLTHIYGSLLTAAGKLKIFIRIIFASVFINIIINLFFIPVHGVIACCVAALTSQYICAICCLITATKKITISFSTFSFLIYVMTCLLLLAVFYSGREAGYYPIFLLAGGSIIAALIMFVQTGGFKKTLRSLTTGIHA